MKELITSLITTMAFPNLDFIPLARIKSSQLRALRPPSFGLSLGLCLHYVSQVQELDTRLTSPLLLRDPSPIGTGSSYSPVLTHPGGNYKSLFTQRSDHSCKRCLKKKKNRRHTRSEDWKELINSVILFYLCASGYCFRCNFYNLSLKRLFQWWVFKWELEFRHLFLHTVSEEWRPN